MTVVNYGGVRYDERTNWRALLRRVKEAGEQGASYLPAYVAPWGRLAAAALDLLEDGLRRRDESAVEIIPPQGEESVERARCVLMRKRSPAVPESDSRETCWSSALETRPFATWRSTRFNSGTRRSGSSSTPLHTCPSGSPRTCRDSSPLRSLPQSGSCGPIQVAGRRC